MLIQMIKGATRVIGKLQGYIGLPLRDERINCAVDGEGTPAMVSAWRPTPDELAALNAGAFVELRVLGTGHPPVMLGVGPVPASDRESILARVLIHAGSEAAAEGWYDGEVIPSLGRTAGQAVDAGMAATVHAYLDLLDEGGFA